MLRIVSRFSAELVLDKHYLFYMLALFAIPSKLVEFFGGRISRHPKIQSEEILGADLCQHIDRIYERSNAQLLDKHGIQFNK